MSTPAPSSSGSGEAARCCSVALDAPRIGRADTWLATVRSAGVPAWHEPLPVEAGDPAALRRGEAERRRPLAAGAPDLRAVLLTHRRGPARLVLVAHRSVLVGDALHELAAWLADPGAGDPPAVPTRNRSAVAALPPRPAAPDWGLGEPGVPSAGWTTMPDLTRPAERTVLTAAAGLLLAHYSAGDERAVGVIHDDTAGRTTVHAVALDDEASVGDWAASWATPAEPPAAGAPTVALVHTSSPPGHDYLPFLAPPVPLLVHWDQHGETGRGAVLHDPTLIDAAVARAWADQLAGVTDQLTAGRGTVGDVEVVDARERDRILALGAAPTLDADELEQTPCARFAEVARDHPDHVAVVAGTTRVSYAELDAHAHRIAAGLVAAGVRPGDRFGIALEPGIDTVAAMIAAGRVGAAYVPMDVRYPADRLRYTIEDAGIEIVLAAASLVLDAGVTVLDPSTLPVPETGTPAAWPGSDPADAAYVIYTSGSTGRPKGVVVPHRNVCALLAATRPDFGLGPDDVWSWFHSSAFDFSVWEIWGALLTGGTLVVVDFWTSRDTEQFHDLLEREAVTVLSQTPSAFGQLVETARRRPVGLAVRLVVFGGEPLDVAMLRPWFAQYPSARCRLVNMFGITETTVHVTAQTVGPVEMVAGSRSVGRAVPGWSLSVRDPRGRLLPLGAPGEICVGGAGVAHGYLGRPELTAERFVDDPYTGGRLYRSGDRGRLRPDGRLDHLGRLDSQVKVRGHRIELDEIRAVLLTHPTVAAAAVVLNFDDPADRSTARLDAYVVTHDGARPPDLTTHLVATLPPYMVPVSVTPVAAIPLTINGKVDVAALPTPAAPPSATATETAAPEPVAVRGLEGRVLAMWSAALGRTVTAADNFFEMGGNSLLVIRLMREMRDEGMPTISTRDFYQNSSVAGFVALVQDRARAS